MPKCLGGAGTMTLFSFFLWPAQGPAPVVPLSINTTGRGSTRRQRCRSLCATSSCRPRQHGVLPQMIFAVVGVLADPNIPLVQYIAGDAVLEAVASHVNRP